MSKEDLITKKYEYFNDLYETELLKRDFDIEETGETLIARYQGKSPLRQPDNNLEVNISKKGKFWTLETQPDFYANRSLLSIGKLRKDEIVGSTFSGPVTGPSKRFYSSELENGIIKYGSFNNQILQYPFYLHEHNTEQICVKNILKEMQDSDMSIYVQHFPKKDMKALGILENRVTLL